MKKFKFAAFIIAAILSCGFITSCGDDEDKPKPGTTHGGGQHDDEVSILGTWTGTYTFEEFGKTYQDYAEVTFNADNTYILKIQDSEDNSVGITYGVYTVSGDLATDAIVKVTYEDNGKTVTETWIIRISGNTAVINMPYGDTMTLTRH